MHLIKSTHPEYNFYKEFDLLHGGHFQKNIYYSGGDYYTKYLKYKQKYLQLKKHK